MSFINTVHVHEVTMATPDIIKIMVRDQEFEHFPPIYMEGLPAWNLPTRRVNPTGANSFGSVWGMTNSHIKFLATRPTELMNRANADLVSAYPSIGGRNVTHISRSSMPYRQGAQNVSSGSFNAVTMEHELYIHLDGNLPAGTYVISHNLNTFPSNTFTFHPNITRCSTISTTQLGHRPEDNGKFAYMQLWMPDEVHANNGAMNLKSLYGISNFNVIDATENVRFTGEITLVSTPESAVDSDAMAWWPTNNTAPKKVIAVNTTTQTMNITNHGYTTGQRKYFRGFQGLTGSTSETFESEITVTGANTFTTNTAFTGTWVPDKYITEHDSMVYGMRYGNRYGTYSYRMDYNNFRPTDANNQYRIQVPGWGVSDQFRIDNTIYYQAAKLCVKGLYNMTLGMPLSMNIGGYERPVNFRDNVNNVYVYESWLPGRTHSEDAASGGFSVNTVGANGQIWRSNVRVEGWFGCFQDAGDWDWHLIRHLPYLWEAIEFGYVQIPEAARNLHFGFPKSSTSFDYTSDYDGIDGLPDVIHIALYYLEPLKRHQKIDGRVYAGMNFWNRNNGGSFGGGTVNEPSWLTSQVPHLLAADHASNACYAFLAAKIGKILYQNGHTTLGNTWIDSANLAYTWANTIVKSYSENGIFGTAWRDYYITTLDFQNRGNTSNALGLPDWQNDKMNTHFNAINAEANQFQRAAAGELFSAFAAQGRLDQANLQFDSVLTANGLTTSLLDYSAGGLWTYLKTPGANSMMSTGLEYAWVNGAENVYDQALNDPANTAYYSSGNGNPSPKEGMQALFYAFVNSDVAAIPKPKTHDNKYLKHIYRGENFHLGANPFGYPCVTGLYRDGPTVLFRDAESPLVSVPGLWCYMGRAAWATQTFAINGADISFYWTCHNVLAGDPNRSAGGGSLKMHEPYLYLRPPGLYQFKNTYVIFATEFVLAGLFTRLAALIFLHAWDGNANNDPTTSGTTFLGRSV